MECLMWPPLEAPRRPGMPSDASRTPPKTAFWPPKTAPRRFQDPDTLRMAQTVPSCSKGRPEALQTSILDPSDLDFGPSRLRVLTAQTSILEYFGSSFAWVFGIVFVLYMKLVNVTFVLGAVAGCAALLRCWV